MEKTWLLRGRGAANSQELAPKFLGRFSRAFGPRISSQSGSLGGGLDRPLFRRGCSQGTRLLLLTDVQRLHSFGSYYWRECTGHMVVSPAGVSMLKLLTPARAITL